MRKDLFGQLLALNQEVAAKIEKRETVTVPGMAKNYHDAKKHLTEFPQITRCVKTVKPSTVRFIGQKVAMNLETGRLVKGLLPLFAWCVLVTSIGAAPARGLETPAGDWS